MKTIQAMVDEARTYAANYPNVADAETRDAIFWSHLAYLINSERAS